MNQSVIIAGGGIAGLAAANMLQKAGYEVTIIEKARAFSNAGFLLSLKSVGIDIMAELGLEAKLIAAQSPSTQLTFLDANGKLIRNLNVATLNQQGARSILMTRSAIHGVLYEAVQDRIRVVFGHVVETVVQTPESVAVTLSTGETMQAAFLVVAEGLRSATRDRYVAEAQVEDFNVFYMAGRLLGRHGLTPGVNRTFMGVGNMLSIFPVAQDELAIQCYLYKTDDAAQLQADAKHLLMNDFHEFPEEAGTLVEAVASRGVLYADKLGMVHAPRLANGRIVLLGDAAYCPTALSGMGASLSLYGAKMLTHFITQAPDELPMAFQQYSAWMQPVIQKFQDNARQNARSFLPRNSLRLLAFKLFFRLVPQAVLLKKMSSQLGLTDEQLHPGTTATPHV